MKIFVYHLLILFWFSAHASPNCELLKDNPSCYKACLMAESALSFGQGNVKFQQYLLKSIELCPDFAYAYFELSIPYAKRGLINEWHNLINRAVQLDPKQYLGWRAWYHWFFMRNYNRAIADIDSLRVIVNYDIGVTGDGLYHLLFLKALCYKGLGENEKAIAAIIECMQKKDYNVGIYDYLHLGVLYLEVGNIDKAILALENQNQHNEVSEAFFYLAQAYQKIGQKSKSLLLLDTALKKYDTHRSMHNPYIQLDDKIYRSDIVNLMTLFTK